MGETDALVTSPGRGVDCWMMSSGSGVFTIRTDPLDALERDEGGLEDRRGEDRDESFPFAWRYAESNEEELLSCESSSDTMARLFEAMDSGNAGIAGRSALLVGLCGLPVDEAFL